MINHVGLIYVLILALFSHNVEIVNDLSALKAEPAAACLLTYLQPEKPAGLWVWQAQSTGNRMPTQWNHQIPDSNEIGVKKSKACFLK